MEAADVILNIIENKLKTNEKIYTHSECNVRIALSESLCRGKIS